MNLLRELTLKGKLIFVVIHQPSSDIFKMFDKMFILDTGGYPYITATQGSHLSISNRLDLQVNSDVGECPNCGNLNPELIFNIIDANVIDEYGNYTTKRKKSPEDWHHLYNDHITIPSKPTTEVSAPKTLSIPYLV
jgi:ABC transport system ATP-binding/permease protein